MTTTHRFDPFGLIILPAATKFALGTVYTTPGLRLAITPPDLWDAMRRHASGDWGDCCPEDRALNDLALSEGSRLLSVYRAHNGTRFWIITEADRSATTALLPEDY